MGPESTYRPFTMHLWSRSCSRRCSRWRHDRSRARGGRWTLLVATALLAALVTGVRDAGAQQNTAVVVDDSPWARELLLRARESTRTNVPEALRLMQELLDGYGDKLIPWAPDDPDRFRSVREAVHEILRADPELLERYRDLETSAADAALEEGDLAAVAASRLLTEPGLVAQIRLAQEDVESGRFAAARSRLDEVRQHPDRRGDVLPHALLLESIAARAAGDVDGANAAADGLGAVGGAVADACRQALVRFEQSVPTPDPVERGALTSDEEWHRIGEVPMQSSLFARSFLNDSATRMVPRSRERIQSNGTLLTAVPTIDGDAVLVNEGHRVRSIDRLSGRTRWERDLLPDAAGRDGSGPGDLNVVTVAGDVALTLSGHAYAAERSGPGRLVCLDLETGASRWEVDLAALDAREEFDGLFPHGAPVVVDDSVLVLARRVNNRLETATYLLSLDLADGSLRWAQHLASSSGVRMGGQRPFSTLVVDGGDVYAWTAVGAVARVDAGRGIVRWLVRTPVPIREPRYYHEPWEVAAPAVIERGVLAALPDQSRVALFDREDGSVLESYPIGLREPWGMPRYFVTIPPSRPGGDDELVAAVGSDLVVFSANALDAPLWSLARVGPLEESDERSGVRGRIQAMDRQLVVPAFDEVVVFDALDGREVAAVRSGEPGNPAVTGPQLVLAGAATLDSFMPFSAAERLMRERIDEAPDEPERALALLGLGMRAERLDLCMEAARIALTAIETGTPTDATRRERAELYARLLDVDAAGLAGTDDEGERLHGFIGAVASTPSEQVRHRLGYGDWLAGRNRVAEAVEAWQSVLDDPTLADAITSARGALVPASSAVVQRLVALADESGRRIYDPQEAFARLQLDQLAGNRNAGRLASLGRTYPLAAAGVDATLLAAELWTAGGDHRSALGALLGAWRLGVVGALDPDQRGRVAGAVVETTLDAGWTAEAIEFLELLTRDGDPVLPTGEARRRASAWLVDLRRSAGQPAASAPVLGDLTGSGRELQGRMLRPAGGVAPALPPDRFAVVADGRVRLIDDALETVWSTDVDDRDPRLLRLDEREMLLWLSATSAEPVAMQLDAVDGSVQWLSPRINEVLPPLPLAAVGRAPEELTPGGAPFDPAEVMPSLVGDALVLVRRNGDAAILDLEAGGARRWSRAHLLRKVYHVAANESEIVLAGVGAAPNGNTPPRDGPLVVVASAVTGELIGRYRPSTGREIRWIDRSPEGVVVVGTEAGIEAFALPGPLPLRPLWSTVGSAARGLTRGWIADAAVVAADDREAIVCRRLADGAEEPRAFAVQPFSKIPARLRRFLTDGDRFLMLFEQRVVAFDRAGRTVGMDAVAEDRDFRFLVPARDRLLAVNALGSEQIELPEGLGRRTQFLYSVYQLDPAQGLKLTGTALRLESIGQRFERVAAIDGWLLLTTGTTTTAIPLPPAR